MHLPRTLELGEFREDELNGLLHAFVRILLDPVAPDFHIACGHTENQRATARHLTQRLDAAKRRRAAPMAAGGYCVTAARFSASGGELEKHDQRPAPKTCWFGSNSRPFARQRLG
jgi:hypothetical protein